jgi:hypothetical protein
MIKRKEKYETPQFRLWLNEYEEGSLYQYDMILSSNYVSPSATKEELQNLANFIIQFTQATKE